MRLLSKYCKVFSFLLNSKGQTFVWPQAQFTWQLAELSLVVVQKNLAAFLQVAWYGDYGFFSIEVVEDNQLFPVKLSDIGKDLLVIRQNFPEAAGRNYCFLLS